MRSKISKKKLWALAYSFGIGLIFCAIFSFAWARDFRKMIKKIEIGTLSSVGFAQSEFLIDKVDQQVYVIETILSRTPRRAMTLSYFLNGTQINSLKVEKKWFFCLVPAAFLRPGTNCFRIENRSQDSLVIKTVRLKNIYGYSRGILCALAVPAENSHSSGIRSRGGVFIVFLLFFLLTFWGYCLAANSSIGRPVFLDGNLIVPFFFGLLLLYNSFSRYKILLEIETIILLLAFFFGWLYRDKISGKKVLAVKVIAALAVFCFVFGIIQYAVNIPQADDYDNILGSMNQLNQSKNFAEVGSILFAQHNEHRLVFNRIVSIAMLKIFGKIDFRWLIGIGNLAIFVLIWIIFRMYRCDDEKFLYFSPAIFFLFQPQYDSFVWAITALSNFYVLAFAALCLYLLLKKTPGAFICALFAASAATFTQANGALVLFVGLSVLIFQKKFFRAAAWFLITLTILFFYFFHYIPPANHPEITFVLSHPLVTLRYFFSLLGNFSHPSLALASGVIILIFFGFLTVKKYFAVNPAIYSLLLFFFISAVAVAVGRAGLGVEQALASRYKIFSISLVILSYLALMEIIVNQKVKRWLLTFFVIFSLLFNFLTYVNMREPLELRRNELIDGIIQWQKNGTGLAYPDRIHADVILRESIKNGIYSIPKQWVIENK